MLNPSRDILKETIAYPLVHESLELWRMSFSRHDEGDVGDAGDAGDAGDEAADGKAQQEAKERQKRAAQTTLVVRGCLSFVGKNFRFSVSELQEKAKITLYIF